MVCAEGQIPTSRRVCLQNDAGITGKVMTTHKIAGNEKPLARGWSDATTFLDDNGNENLIIFGGLSGNDENPKRLNDIWILRKV